MRSCLKGITGVLKGTVVLLCLLYPDYTVAQCQCNLTYATRLMRDNETETYAKQYAGNFTLRQTDRLLSDTIPPFNLTAKLNAYIRSTKSTQDVPSIPGFITKGGLYGINWTNFTSGYTGSNDSKVYRTFCNVTGCYPEWVFLPDYLLLEYYYSVIYQLRNLATWARYPVGAYRRDRNRYYNYSGYDPMLPPPKVCSCSSTGGYFYRMRFQIDPWNLTKAHYDNTTVTSKLLMTDLELAVDNFTSSTFNELYIQSDFEKWEWVHSSVFFMILYFKDYYDANWTNHMSDIKAKLSGLDILKLEYLKTHLVITIKPYAVACNWYEEGENGTVPRLTTLSSTLQTETLSSTLQTDTTSSGMLTTTLGTEMSSTYSTSSTESASQSSSIVPNTTTMGPSTSSNMESSFLTSSSSETTIPSESFIATRTTLLSVAGDQYSQTNGSYSTVPIQRATNVSIAGTSSSKNDPGTTGSTFSTLAWSEITGNSTHFANGTLKSLWDEITGNSTHFANKTLRSTWNEITGNATHFANGTQKFSNTLTTPFDEDPLFKAVVRVIPKVYNDKVLLKIGRNPLPITAQALLYTVAIPTTIGSHTASLAPSQPPTTQLSGNTGNTGSTGLQSSQPTGHSVTAVPNPTSNNGSSGTNPSQNLQTETTTIPSTTNNSVNLAINSSITPFLNGSIQTTTNLVTGNGTLGQAGSTPSTNITPQIIVTSSTTPFDEDPLFKANADIPVMTKVYNDQLMLKGRGATGEPLTQQALFYSVAIPAATGLILTTMLLLICQQIDWNGTAASSKSIT